MIAVFIQQPSLDETANLPSEINHGMQISASGDWSFMRRKSFILVLLSLFLMTVLLEAQFEIGIAENRFNETFQDSEPPVISTEPEDLSYIVGATGNTLYWEYSDEDLASVQLYLDGVTILFDVMIHNPTSLTWDIDGLSVGLHNYTLYIDDIFSQFSTSTVFVTVVTSADAPPNISHPMDLFSFAGDPAANCTWIGSDSDPNIYTVYRNGTEIASGPWISGIPIIVPLSSLQFGIHNLTIVLEDDIGNIVSDTVIVWVLPSTFPQPTIPSTFDIIVVISIGITLVGVVLIAILAKRGVR